jgi:hypothetical protein
MSSLTGMKYTGCNWKVRPKFGHEFHIPKQKCAYQHWSGSIHFLSYSRRNAVVTYSIVVISSDVGDCLVGPHVCHIGLQATTTEISSYMNCHSYRKMYHWQSEHECGTCMMVLRAVRDVLNNFYYGGWISRGGPTAWPPNSAPDLTPLDSYLWGHLRSLVYAAPVDNEETLHHRIVDACQTIRNCPRISERMWRSMMKRYRGVRWISWRTI